MTEKDDIYKNLEFVSKAYSVAEGAFPLWEAVFALIVGQILVTYFSINENHYQKIMIALLGVILSFAWLYLVGLNYLNADHINKKMLILRDILSKCSTSTPFIWPWPIKEDKENWNLMAIITGQLPEQPRTSIATLIKSTWVWRKILPGILLLFWVVLIIWQIKQVCNDSHKMILVYYTKFLFFEMSYFMIT
jgi:hypothetical protein